MWTSTSGRGHHQERVSVALSPRGEYFRRLAKCSPLWHGIRLMAVVHRLALSISTTFRIENQNPERERQRLTLGRLDWVHVDLKSMRLDREWNSAHETWTALGRECQSHSRIWGSGLFLLPLDGMDRRSRCWHELDRIRSIAVAAPRRHPRVGEVFLPRQVVPRLPRVVRSRTDRELLDGSRKPVPCQLSWCRVRFLLDRKKDLLCSSNQKIFYVVMVTLVTLTHQPRVRSPVGDFFWVVYLCIAFFMEPAFASKRLGR
jgi:hypothetical protein